MNKHWIPLIFALTFCLLSVLKAKDQRSLSTFYRADRPLKIDRFSEVKSTLRGQDVELFELWESILTGRTAPLSAWIKDRYRLLALNHLFTPSGFHLSAVLMPVMKTLRSTSSQLFVLVLVGSCLYFLPGFGALKRMVLIKGHQKILGQKIGFFFALLVDVLFGSFQSSTLSFSYSFLFLGIIYSGRKGVALIFTFFLGQILIAYFQGTHLPPFLIVLSPVLNFFFGLAMPFLFILALPMWNWQIQTGLFILKCLQFLVDASAGVVTFLPPQEVTVGVLTLVACLYFHHMKTSYIILALLSGSLNLCTQKVPSWGTKEYKPLGRVVKVIQRKEEDLVYFEDGKCKRRLVKGIWWEKCSPSRRSTRKKLS